MFDLLLLIIGVILCLIGIVGSFVPIIPGPMTSWFGLLVLNFTDAVNFNLQFLAITLIIAIVISAMDYIIPIIGVKKLGGSKGGLIGASIGLITGLIIMGPIGIFLGSFIGAIAGEMINKKNTAHICWHNYHNTFKFLDILMQKAFGMKIKKSGLTYELRIID